MIAGSFSDNRGQHSPTPSMTKAAGASTLGTTTTWSGPSLDHSIPIQSMRSQLRVQITMQSMCSQLRSHGVILALYSLDSVVHWIWEFRTIFFKSKGFIIFCFFPWSADELLIILPLLHIDIHSDSIILSSLLKRMSFKGRRAREKWG